MSRKPKKLLFEFNSLGEVRHFIGRVSPAAHSLLSQLHSVAAALLEVDVPVKLFLTEAEVAEMKAAGLTVMEGKR